MSRMHVVVMSKPATGHINPTLPLVKELCRRGAVVTFFVKESMRSFVEAAGATWKPMHELNDFSQEARDEFGVTADASPETYSFPKGHLAVAATILPGLIQELEALRPRPSVIVYDPFLVQGLVAARVLAIPCIGMLTMPGPGVLSKPPVQIEALEASPLVQMGRKRIQDAYDCDVLEKGLLQEFYSPDGNIVTTIQDLFAGPSSEVQRQRFGDFESWTCVGPLVDMTVKRVAHAMSGSTTEELPWDTIDAAINSGKRLLYVSMGTVANGFYYSQAFGINGQANGLAELTGRDFLRYVFGNVFEALRNRNILVVMGVGPHADVLEGLDTPGNFILVEAVPQLSVLSKCHGFISHGGANSMHEALSFGVPMAVIPAFADQPTNADTVALAGAGFSFTRPLESLTVQALTEAVMAILDPSDSNSYRAKAVVLMHKMKAAGGVAAAADTVFNIVHQKAPGILGGA